MGVEVLVQIDRLVQLLETPVFNFLRLHLLHPARYPALLWYSQHHHFFSNRVRSHGLKLAFICGMGDLVISGNYNVRKSVISLLLSIWDVMS